MKELTKSTQRTNTGNFLPRTDKAGRIAILALYRNKNVKQNVIAKAFGMGRRTVSKIINEHNGEYVYLKSQVAKMTDEEMNEYITDEIIEKINAAAEEMEKKEA